MQTKISKEGLNINVKDKTIMGFWLKIFGFVFTGTFLSAWTSLPIWVIAMFSMMTFIAFTGSIIFYTLAFRKDPDLLKNTEQASINVNKN